MSIKRLGMIILLALCAGAILMSAEKTPEIFEYNVLSPKVESPEPAASDEQGRDEQTTGGEKMTALEEMLTGLQRSMEELGSVTSSYGVVAYAPNTMLTGTAGGEALVKGQWGSKLHPDSVLLEGRQLYIEEIEMGAYSAVIDEKLAIALYRVGNPVGRTLTISGVDFTVVGVTRGGRTLGDREASRVLVPLKALDKAGVQTKMLSVVMKPKSGSGAYAALSQAMSDWYSGGDFYSMSKEAYRVSLPLRLTLCVLGAMAVAVTLKLSGRATRAIFAGGKRKLESRYAVNILPELFLRGLTIFVMYALNTAAIALILQAALAPVYIFPEWVPGNLVDPVKIIETFWTLRSQETGLLSLRTPDLLRLKYLHRLMTMACAGIFFLLLRPYHLWKHKVFDE